jgi:hypothetical protein
MGHGSKRGSFVLTAMQIGLFCGHIYADLHSRQQLAGFDWE